MTEYKTIATITWKFESSKCHREALEYAKARLEEILETKPHGIDFDGFSVQVDLAKMKDRKRLIHIAEFSLDEVFPFVTEEDSKRDYLVDGKTYQIRMNSDRYHIFKANNKCVSCSLEGTKMILDMNPGDNSPHFNLYAEEHGRLVLMTKDHVLAKSKGGTDALSNLTTTCSICNNLKGNYDLTYEQVFELRQLWNNNQKLPKKVLRDLINNTRTNMDKKNKCVRKRNKSLDK
jgi:5-methylcytosine-specific restriction endonuclease McrA